MTSSWWTYDVLRRIPERYFSFPMDKVLSNGDSEFPLICDVLPGLYRLKNRHDIIVQLSTTGRIYLANDLTTQQKHVSSRQRHSGPC